MVARRWQRYLGRHGACGERTVVPIMTDNLECRQRNYMV